MPHKYNAARRHRIPKRRYKVPNWQAYEAGLRQRGSLTIWFTGEAIAAWRAGARTTPGGSGGVPDHAGGSGAHLGSRDRDNADPEDSVSPAASPDRGAGRLPARAD